MLLSVKMSLISLGKPFFFSYFFLDRLTCQQDRALKIKDCDLYPLTVICSKVTLRFYKCMFYYFFANRAILNILIVLSCLISCFHKFQIGRSLHNIVDLCLDFNIIWALS